MPGLNRSILAGRLVADPVVRYTKNETAVAHFCLAINRGSGETADFINCVAWKGLAKVCEEYLKKGRLVAVEGRLQTRSYNSKSGEKKTVSEVIIEHLQMLDFKSQSSDPKPTEELVAL